jgi:hypothetical protein
MRSPRPLKLLAAVALTVLVGSPAQADVATYEEALQLAARQDQPVLLDFFTTW